MMEYTETYEFLLTILRGLPYGVIAVDMDGYITMCNEQALKHLDVNKRDAALLETSIFDYLEKAPILIDVLENRLARGRAAFDLTVLAYEEKYLTIRGRRILNGMIITIEDVTQSKKQEKINLNAMLEGQETERRRLAEEIHDGIGSVLSTIKLHLDAVKSDLTDVSEKTLKKINIMSELIQETANDLRNISHALTPSALIDLGLASALDNLCQRANQSEKVQVEFYQSGMEERLDLKLALGIFRIAQELLNNAFKYAQAKVISVQLIKRPDAILLMVEDDGVGFDNTAGKKIINKGIGLRNIRTRTKYLGGHFMIDTQKGRGVLATVEVPLEAV